jgi:Pyridoxamine 5'-phosphate oxidase
VKVVQEKRLRIWQTETELPPDVFEAWRKPDGAISPVAIVATVDPDGMPHTAPFGSLRAITPRLLRLFCWREHDTYANLCRDGRVSLALVSPDVAVSVTGQARVVRERAHHDEQFAILEIDIETVKNDMAYRIVVESGIEIVAKERHKPWYDAAMAELEALEQTDDWRKS